MNFGSLFSGIGGLDLGLEWAGMICKWQVELDPYCLKVLNKHWPDIPKFKDVKNCGRHNLEPVELICGGFPCQPWSLAGQRRGEEDDRNLWPETFRIVADLRPRYFVGENVPGIAPYLDTIFNDLERAGYEGFTVEVPAAAFDAPHLRYRVFIVAYSKRGQDYERERADLEKEEPSGQGGDSTFGISCEDVSNPISTDGGGRPNAGRTPDQGGGTSEARGEGVQPQDGEARTDNIESGSEDVADTKSERLEGRNNGQGREREKGMRLLSTGSSESENVDDSSQQRLDGSRNPGERGWPEYTDSGWWSGEPDVGRVAHGVPSRVDRLKGLGNAVVPQVAEWIGKRIMEFDGHNPN